MKPFSLLQIFQLQVVIQTYRFFPLDVFVISEFSSKEQVDHMGKVNTASAAPHFHSHSIDDNCSFFPS